jgi:hypothetical protein
MPDVSAAAQNSTNLLLRGWTAHGLGILRSHEQTGYSRLSSRRRTVYTYHVVTRSSNGAYDLAGLHGSRTVWIAAAIRLQCRSAPFRRALTHA